MLLFLTDSVLNFRTFSKLSALQIVFRPELLISVSADFSVKILAVPVIFTSTESKHDGCRWFQETCKNGFNRMLMFA